MSEYEANAGESFGDYKERLLKALEDCNEPARANAWRKRFDEQRDYWLALALSSEKA